MMETRTSRWGWPSVMCLALMSFARAQAPQPRAEFDAAVLISDREKATLVITARIDPGWHVYALDQPAGGPTPLAVAIKSGEPVKLIGTPAGTRPIRHHDASFDLETAYYESAFELRYPLSLAGGHVPATIPVDVRFQACSDRECLPPRTLRIDAQVNPPSGQNHAAS